MYEVEKNSSALGALVIKPVEKALAKALIVQHHYSHKWNEGGFGKFSYGIFKKEAPNDCLGVAVYGYMKNVKAKMFTHPNPQAWMCELNRLWISDVLGYNAETILIAASIKLMRKADPNIVAVQSFADGRLGCGTIYKAANFQYFGYHYTKFAENIRTGEFTHEQILTNSTCTRGYLRANVAYLIGDLRVHAVKTYRYIYPLCRHFKFKLPQQPYPAYDKGMEATEWNRDTTAIKKKIVYLLKEL